MRVWWLPAMACMVAACSGRRAGLLTTPEETTPQFVDIDLTLEYDLLNSGLLSELTPEERRTECGDLAMFEPAAKMGSLDDPTIDCLLTLLDDTQRLTGKDKISRVLLVDAWEKNDRHRWESLAARHLQDIDQSDADLAYQLSYYLVSTGNPDRMGEAMYWAEVGLERRDYWEGQTHVDRTFHLHKFRTFSALKRWAFVESEVKANPTRERQERAEAARLDVRVAAGEWQAYARASRMPIVEPQRVCEMATGLPGPCAEDLSSRRLGSIDE
ncbi:MAG: hypothetical protein KTR31_20240 [Myxococcales bacterium]|nr:hypothetical protein [Myxococcales bacterium]